MKERLQKILHHPLTIPITIGVVSAGAAYGVGYVVGKRTKTVVEVHEVPEQLGFDYDEMEAFIAKEEEKRGITRVTVEEVQDEEEEEESEPTEVVTVGADFVAEKLKEAMTTNGDTEQEVVTNNIFAGGDDEWNYEEELKKRSSSEPYVIHKDEFYAEELGYSQQTLTYYAGDDILCDQEDAPVYNHKQVIGPLLFGHGSTDPNVFHVRNDKRKAEYEILFDPGLYSVDVLGLDIEDNQRVKNLEHSKVRKFRME